MHITHNRVLVDGRVETRPAATAVRSDGIRVAWSLFARAFGAGGEREPRWVRVVAADALAEWILRTVVAGDSVRVFGSLDGRCWIDSSGHRRSIVELRAQRLRIRRSMRRPKGACSESAEPMASLDLFGAGEGTQ